MQIIIQKSIEHKNININYKSINNNKRTYSEQQQQRKEWRKQKKKKRHEEWLCVGAEEMWDVVKKNSESTEWKSFAAAAAKPNDDHTCSHTAIIAVL